MKNVVLGLHHVAAVAGQAQRTYDLYTKLLGLRLVKKTVDCRDPGTYHLYFGDETGSPGTLLTFFPSNRVVPGRPGIGEVSALGYSVPSGSFPFWMARLEAHHVPYRLLEERFGEPCLAFSDPDGLPLELIVSNTPDERVPWTTPETGPEFALRGLHSVQLTLVSATDTVKLLTEVFGYRVLRKQGSCFRLITDTVAQAAVVDVVETPPGSPAQPGGSAVHHLAFRVADEAVLLHFRELLVARHLSVTPVIDRRYFRSLYFQEPGGLCFALATDTPGFAIDEPRAELGTHLVLPPEYESRRSQITAQFPHLQ
ncbi:VOC family protein [Hymenobacter terricola]|uniref:VOC family protein n=1 Tax=Hymenobacter terricola TaxID=2819236 RepID=UPI001B313ABD|nr:VOC family protein [Hymenobacter terricola]